MMRRAMIACVVFALSAWTGFRWNRRPPIVTSPRAAMDEVYERVMPRVEIGNTTVGQAITYLRAQTGANVVANWPALKTDGITPDTAYDPGLILHDVTVEQALNRLSIADGCATAVPFLRPTHIFDARSLRFVKCDGFIQLENRDYQEPDTAPESDSRNIITCQHRVVDLLGKDGPWERLCIIHGNHSFAPPLTNYEREEMLSETIMSLVDMEGWRDEGGHRGTMRFMLGQLLVSTTPANQRAIDQVIQTLRAAR